MSSLTFCLPVPGSEIVGLAELRKREHEKKKQTNKQKKNGRKQVNVLPPSNEKLLLFTLLLIARS